jgi:hypothetical protein
VSRKKSYYRFERERQRERVREVYVFLHSFIRRIATSCFRCKRLKPKKRERFLSGWNNNPIISNTWLCRKIFMLFDFWVRLLLNQSKQTHFFVKITHCYYTYLNIILNFGS